MKYRLYNTDRLSNDIEAYKKMFPNTYTTREDIEKRLESMDNIDGYFGIEVSSEWEDKCYGFGCARLNGDTYVIEYEGVWKS